ncbi:hypothetical protein BAZOLSSOX_536 [uncultured Gammaproteobacteria bacterium]|nr:hypothetical protein [uncultured Gammaproteobacteria bacterium]VVH55756.1 hypothetical protein BAZOLSSOX_536 [uncultured Gammaproteobacteria bacterium]
MFSVSFPNDSPPHRWLRKLLQPFLCKGLHSPPHRWLRNADKSNQDELTIHHHTGGLEICFLLILTLIVIHHHTGGLEIIIVL